ncbi:MAG: hypothetical protein NWQ06_09970 [Leeuwenhoekiella sp.]|nr:hypothetical protein [Leeuwenhoekiella sp.]
MISIYKTRLLIALMAIIPFYSIAQTMQFEPLNAYWDLVDTLKNGDSLSKEKWDDFLAIEANRTYVDNQGFDANYLERFRKNLELVYMPKNDSLLQTYIPAIEKDPSSYWFIYKVYVYKKYENELKAFQKQLEDPKYINRIYEQAFEWLPRDLQRKETGVNFYLIGIENDAIAGGEVVIATLWNLYNQDKINLGSTAGHEMHHILRNPVNFESVAESDLGLLYFLNGVLNEGSADMIDKPKNIQFEDEIPGELQFKEFVLDQADSIIKAVNTNIIELQKSKGASFKTERDYRNLVKWTSGHCPGYYMADIIVRNGYKKQLLKNIQNPFYFMYLYNKAAKKDKSSPALFSESSIKYIKSLETKYWVEPRGKA